MLRLVQTVKNLLNFNAVCAFSKGNFAAIVLTTLQAKDLTQTNRMDLLLSNESIL